MKNNPSWILVVDDDASITELLRLILEREGYAVFTARTAEEAWPEALRQPPALIISDVQLPGMDGYAFCRQLRLNPITQAIPILMLTSKAEIADKIAGFEAGADDYLIKPFESEEIPYRIRNLLMRASRPPLAVSKAERRARLIVFFGAKGGVGKTTIAVNFSLALHSHTRSRVAIFDADFSFGDLGLQLNLPAARTALDLVREPAEMDAELLDRVLATHSTGVRVLLSPLQRERAELITLGHIKRILELLTSQFDFVVVDCHSTYDERTLEILEEADDLFLVVTPEVGPLVNAGAFFELADKMNIGTAKIRVILNRANSDVGIAPGEVERSLNQPIAFRVVSGGRPVVQSVNRGTPIVLERPTHPFSQQIMPMVEYVVRQQTNM